MANNLTSVIDGVRTGARRLLRRDHPVVAVLRLAGVISSAPYPRRGTLNLAALAPSLETAFKLRNLKAVALAADRIYADQNTIVGSIGVISAGFGFTGLLDKLGVERRLYKQGDNKTLLDPFLPEQEDDVARLHLIQKEMHESFKAVVKARRGDRLVKRKDKQLFSGDIWTGARAVDLGLIDGLGDLRAVMRESYGANVKLRVVGRRDGWVMRRLGLGAAPDLGDWGAALVAALEDRAHWARFGL